MNITHCPEPADLAQWQSDLAAVRGAAPDLLRVLRKICAANTKPDLMIAITEGVTLCEKLPIL